MGQFLVMLGQAVGIELFDRVSDGSMEFLPPLHQKAVIRHILDHSVLEDIGRLGEEPLFVDDLQRFQLA